MYSAIVFGKLLTSGGGNCQTVDISQSLKSDTKGSQNDPAQELEAAMMIEERDYQTLGTVTETTPGFRVDNLHKSWKKWMDIEINKAKCFAPNEADERYKKLIVFARNRINYLNASIKRIKNGGRGNNDLSDLLDKVIIAEYPMDFNPDVSVKRIADKKLIDPLSRAKESFVIPPEYQLPLGISESLELGDYEKSLKLAEEAKIYIYEKHNDDSNLKLKSLIWLQRLNLDFGNIEEAKKCTEEADVLCKKNEVDARLECLANIYKARMYFAINQHQDGMYAIKKAISIFKSSIDTGSPLTGSESPYIAGVVTTITNESLKSEYTSECKTELKELDELVLRLAESTNDKMLAPDQQIEMDGIRVKVENAKSEFQNGNYEKAMSLCNSIHMCEGEFNRLSTGGEFSRENTLYLDIIKIRAMALKNSQQDKCGGKTLSELSSRWVELYQKRFNDIMQIAPESQKLQFFSKEDPFSFLVNLEDPLSLAKIIFCLKGAVLESMFNAKSIAANSANVSLKNKLQNLEQGKALAQNSTNSLDALALEKLKEDERNLAEDIRKSYKESDLFEFIKNMDFKSIPSNIPSDSAYIDYIQYVDNKSFKPHYAALVITSSGKLTLQKLSSVDKVDSIIDSFRNEVCSPQNPDSDKKTESLCRELYSELINPLSNYVSSCKQLIISPDGKLNFIPFSVFLTTDNKFLIEKCIVRYVSSGRDLLRKTLDNPDKSIVIIDNPLFTKTSTPDSPATDVFTPLPGTVKESQNLFSLMTNASYSATLLEGTNATEVAIKALKSPKILHIATHGFNLTACSLKSSNLNTRGMKVVGGGNTNSVATQAPVHLDPMFKTGLALCGANDTFRDWSVGIIPDSRNDGILMAGEVPLLDLSKTSLVTLSACQTAEGEAIGGEGVFGLRRGFLQAGAKNLLMTLWPIADQETVNIMSDYYKKISTNDSDPGADLCAVQKEYLNKLRSEKGICFAINRAAPFILFGQGSLKNSAESTSVQSVADTKASQPLSTHIQPLLDSTPHPVSTPIKPIITKAIDSASFNQNQTSNQQAQTVTEAMPAILEFNDALAKADAGDAYSQAVVSIYYTMGYKAPKDTAKGLAYAMKSAAQKHPLGIYQVGILRELGAGMKKSKKEGHLLMANAFDGLNALNGDPYALYDLGCMAIEGVGVDQNPKEAARLFKASADLGYAPAQRIYAKFLEAGVGAPKDLEAARQYQSQSSAQWSEQ
jgi:CHAT domain-containing protein